MGNMPLARYASPHFRNVTLVNFYAGFSFMWVFRAFIIYVGTLGIPILSPLAMSHTASAALVNTIFHIRQTAKYKKYTPGVVTAVLIYLPWVTYAFYRALNEGFTNWFLIVVAFIIVWTTQKPWLHLVWWVGGFISGRGMDKMEY